MKPKCVIMLSFFKMLYNSASCRSECHRPPNVPCCYNNYLDPIDNTCTECKPGRIGWNCNYSCKEGYFGSLCKQSCKCNFTYCDPEVGCLLEAVDSKKSMVSEDNRNISENSSTTKIFLKFSEMANDSTETEDTVMTRSLVPGSKELSHGHITKDEDSGKILQLISEQLQMMCISLFLILAFLIILPLVLWYNIRKRTRKPDIHIGMKQSDTSAMNNRQSLAMMMERGYTDLSNRDRGIRSGSQSNYSTPLRLGRQSNYSTPLGNARQSNYIAPLSNGRESDYCTPQNIEADPYTGTL